MKVFSFSAEDLRFNRAGQFSPAQRAALDQQRRVRRRTWIAVLGFDVLLLGAVLVAIVSGSAPAASRAPGLILAVIFAAGFAYYFWIIPAQIERDLALGVVVSARGGLRLGQYKYRQSSRYQAKVGIVTFPVTTDAYQALREFKRGAPDCVLYYASVSKIILSFEPLTADPEPQ